MVLESSTSVAIGSSWPFSESSEHHPGSTRRQRQNLQLRAICLQEVEGESEERRNARLKQHMKTQERMAKALAEKTQHDLQSQNEQEEKHRLAETLDYDIKRWATGKEGNLRALLSSVQHVLWPECGWQPVSLTDLITSTSVKKKYIAEKVFDLLKEAWNKFNTDELR
ncbi:hypothetical protein K7X08_032065 [Anisodus acutangulus]|uniref:Uncharacterized protein n=1 Tax=Anisodus acutangulus TaxID=402998 RepID=A0A9Q1RJW6_9SOLA|nr:hypothetical protein K7X08_032065 [Anisodus acutangulus]